MIYLIFAGLILVLFLAVSLVQVEPMPEDMADEEERARRSQGARIDVRWWQVEAGYRPKAIGDRLQDRDPKALQAKVYPFRRRA